MAMTSLRLDESASAAEGGEVWQIYDAVFHDQPYEAWESIWHRHRAREGFRLARAYGDRQLVGFAYGYTGQPGQWWTDNAARALGPAVAVEWLGNHFEFVELAVLPAARRRGLGRQLVRKLTTDLAADRMVLQTTSDDSDPARRLYQSEGWHVLGPGVGDATVVMGETSSRSLPMIVFGAGTIGLNALGLQGRARWA